MWMCLESRDSFITVGFQKMSRAWKENLGILEDERLEENLSLGSYYVRSFRIPSLTKLLLAKLMADSKL